MTWKRLIVRLILISLTIMAIWSMGYDLLQSWHKPQIQSRLELYQANLFLHAAQWHPKSDLDLKSFSNNLREQAQTGLEQERDALKLHQTSLLPATESTQIAPSPMISAQDQSLVTTKLVTQSQLDELDLRLGLVKASSGHIDEAIQGWTSLLERPQTLITDPQLQVEVKTKLKTATVLIGLWSNPPRILPNAETLIQKHLDGWFRYSALAQLYQLQQRQDAFTNLFASEQLIAQQALVKLVILNVIPLLAGVTGVGLLIFLLIQLAIKRQESFLAQNANLSWETPWNGETIWQVLVIGFFFVSQIFLPLLLGSLGFAPEKFNVRSQSFYLLFTYVLSASGGLMVLYFLIKDFLPLPESWFRISLKSNWFWWGLGGYCVALPLVIIVSLINQQLWQGLGGSNPILPIALEGKDGLALVIFFITASIAAPIYEEILFRGFLLPSLTRYLPLWGAIAVSSLLFALAHLSLSEVLPLTTLGMVLAFVYTRSRNLLSSMFLHSLWNAGTLLSLYILGSSTN